MFLDKQNNQDYYNGWLSLTGIFYPCDFMGHRDLARELEEELNLVPQLDLHYHIVHGEELLEILGWIKLYFNIYNGDGNIIKCEKAGFKKSITEQQIKFLDGIWDKMTSEQKRDYRWLLEKFNGIEDLS